MAKNKKLYDEKSIESLSPLEFTRLRPGVYAGDTTYSTQLLIEIISNVIDEFRIGHGDVLKIKIDKDVVTVEDEGQGFIFSKREDGKTILEASFSVLNTSGKYREDGTYEGSSLGSFGIGSKITTFLSHWLEVTSYRDSKYETVRFSEGVFEKRKTGKCPANKHGTIVSWQPSEEFFTNTEVNIEELRSLLETSASLCVGLKIELDYNGKKEKFYSENGLDDIVDKMVGDSEILNKRCKINWSKDKEDMNFILTYTDSYTPTIIPYVNTGFTEKGPHITAIKTLLTKEFNRIFRENGIIKSKTDSITGEDIQEGLFVLFNLTSVGVAYDAQVKTTITKIDMSNFLTAIANGLDAWSIENNKEIKIIAEKLLMAKRAREAARKAKETARNTQVKKRVKNIDLPTKLVDAWNKNRDECELLITEGDSAANGLISARDSKNTAVFPIRGKILSIRKATVSKIFANQEITNIIKAVGLELDKKTHKLIYDKKRLRYGKIIFCTDADPDGFAIKNLLINVFWWLCPDLFFNNHIYVAVPPLFRITTNKNEYIYLRDSRALEDYKKKHKTNNYTINRLKGLGEMNPEELSDTLLDPKTRNVLLLEAKDFKSVDRFLEVIEGNDVAPRREYLLKHGEEKGNES